MLDVSFRVCDGWDVMNLAVILSSVWILSLPFYHFSLIGSLSLDNILSPLLFMFIVLRMLVGAHSLSRQQLTNIAIASGTTLLYLTVHSINLLSTQQAVWASVYVVAKNMLYFILPVLFVSAERDLKRSSFLMIVVMIMGSLSALVSALGLLTFDFARQAESRLELAYLPKSVGLFTAYGDMALLISLALLLALGARTYNFWFVRTRLLAVLVVVVSALIGVLSMQSRNLVFTIAVAFIVYLIIGRWRKRGVRWARKLYLSLAMSILTAVVVVVLFSGPLIDWVEGVGGTSEAAATVHARLEQYQYGWSLVENSILLGASPSVREKNEVLITFIHNMWLKELVQGGLLGILAIFVFYYRAMRNQVARFSADRASIARAYIAVLIGSLIATQFYPGDTPIFWVLMGLATALPLAEIAEKQPVETARTGPAGIRSPILARRRTHGAGG